MPVNLDPAESSAIVAACLGAISGPDGPTEEQLTLLRSVSQHLWLIEDVDLSPASAISAEEAATRITGDLVRRRTREFMVFLEMCRHPLEEAHARRVEEYCIALGGDGPGMEIVRDYVTKGADAAVEDFMRRFTEVAPSMMEPEMLEIAQVDEETAAARFAEIEAALRAAAPGTLGAEFVDFYDRNGFTIGEGSISLFGHDMAHVIGGYDASAIGEICLGAMKLMISNSDTHWLEFLGSLMIHETGVLLPGYVEHVPPLTDPANIELMVAAMDRGRATEKDFSVDDHLAMVDWPYADVLAHYGVPPH
ncbi:MAG: hypothetical protein KGR18_11275 [Acidobacteria bacterium]|nr:hypothetical protein [Acidobacteriota bacterium]